MQSLSNYNSATERRLAYPLAREKAPALNQLRVHVVPSAYGPSRYALQNPQVRGLRLTYRDF